MSATIVAFLTSLIGCFLIIHYQHLHNHISGDSELSGPQKFHSVTVPRIGGLAIFIALLFASILRWMQDSSSGIYFFNLIIASLPAWLIGLSEDLTKKISIRTRLFFTLFSAIFAGYLLDAWITHINIPSLDFIISIPIISIILTSIAITGLANAYNIIDGFNGLASMVAIIALLAIAYVGFRVMEITIVIASLSMAGALTGFFFWNYPRGLIFLGDGGAYLIGFWIALLSILLVTRNTQVSPWFAVLVNCYPIFETIFSIWRRFLHQGKSPGQADATHFHSLIYRRIIRWSHTNSINNLQYLANAKTSPYLWLFSSLAVLPSILWWEYTWALQLSVLIFSICYIYLYLMIIKFKVPKWIRLM